MNPQNGLCMNILYHSAFDQGFFTITEEYKILISPEIYKKKDIFIEKVFLEYDNKSIFLPQKFLPDKEFLNYHNDKIFRK